MTEGLMGAQFVVTESEGAVAEVVFLPERGKTSVAASQASIEVLEVDEINKRCRWLLSVGSNESSPADLLRLGFKTLDHLFERNFLQKVQVTLFADELQLIELHRRLGFCEEGRLVRQMMRDGGLRDVVLLAHFKEAWEKKRKSVELLFSGGGRIL